MKPGDIIESAIWLAGDETDQMIQSWKDRVRETTNERAKMMNVQVGPFTWIIKSPGDERVPQVPDHIHGINVRLLVGEAVVLGAKQTVIHKQSGFVYDLTEQDLNNLRQITRRAHAKRNPGSRLDDKQCDAVIEHLGPEIAIRTLRSGRFDA